METTMLPIVAPATEDSFTANLQALFKQHEQDLKIIDAQRLEIERLTEELRALRAGAGVEVVIDGQRFALSVSPGKLGHKSELADSFIL